LATTVAVVLFTDLVGSTALLSRVGEERAEELRREHFAVLRDTLRRVGGQEIKNLGDGLMIIAPSAAEGAACAVALQQACEVRNRRAEEPLMVRVGMSLGDADVEDGDYFGVPVIEAARLCAVAEGGEILATEVVRQLARTRRGLVFAPVGELNLKGLDVPVPTCRVIWLPSEPVDERPPFPARLASARAETFVGRTAEVDQLLEAWKHMLGDGVHRSFLVAGEPGIGKTSLVARVSSVVYDEGAIVVYGRADEDLGIPYQPWIEVLTQLVEGLPEAVLAAHVADRGAHLARLVPRLATRLGTTIPPSADPETERYVLFGCVVDLLAWASAEHPVVVVLDDLHWADRPSLQLLRHVVSAEVSMRVGVVGTFRDSDVAIEDPLTELLAALHREGGTGRIVLRGLSDVDLLALLENMAGHDMDEEGVALRDALLSETAGNPFFVGEILRHLAETGAIVQLDGRWVATADLRGSGLPVSVREVVGRRLRRLGPDTERVLAVASVIGRDFELRLLANVTQVDEDDLIDLCDAAVAAAVLQETDRADRYTFAHALVEHALYDSLSQAKRSRAHGAVAEALEQHLGADPAERAGELAYHWAATHQSGSITKAVYYSAVAGRRALDLLAPDEALRWFTQALESLDRDGDDDQLRRVELLVGLGDAQRQCGISDHRQTLLDASRLADQIGATDLLVRAVLLNNRGYQSAVGGIDYERIAAIDLALQRVGDSPTAERAQLLALSAIERVYVVDLDERLALAQEGVALARASGDRSALLLTLQRPSTGISHPSTLELRTAWSSEATQIAEDLGDIAMQYWVQADARLAALERGDGDAIDDEFQRCARIKARIPYATIQWSSTVHDAWTAGLRGDIGEYERLAEVAFALGSSGGEPDALMMYGAHLINIRDHQGRLGEMVPLIEQAVADFPALPAFRPILLYARTRGGEVDEASSMLEEDLATGFKLPADHTWSTGMACWANAAFLLGMVEAAPTLRDLIRPYHDQIVNSGATFWPGLCHYLGLLDHLDGQFDDADRRFTEALALHERVRSPILVASTQASWAALLCDRSQGDDVDRAGVLAHAALDTAGAHGYGNIERDAMAAIARIGT
jgi:class 3 adenylate cyclase/tetratricopeptide (TPR) repeat protein